jgi:hypothetical protein
MPTAQSGRASISIAASPEMLYGLITDVTRMGEWSPECYRCEWLDGGSRPAVGARFRGYNRRGLMRWERTAVVTVADRGREFAFATVNDRSGRQETRWHFLLEPSPHGTVLTESFRFMWCSLPVRTAELFVPRGRQVQHGIEETVRRIKSVADALHPKGSVVAHDLPGRGPDVRRAPARQSGVADPTTKSERREELGDIGEPGLEQD